MSDWRDLYIDNLIEETSELTQEVKDRDKRICELEEELALTRRTFNATERIRELEAEQERTIVAGSELEAHVRKLETEIGQTQAYNARLREALRPFATNDEKLSVEHFHRARAALVAEEER